MALRADIAASPRTRGRPKGTGIDDRDRVVQVRDMLAADRGLKPTTAIKRLGITDPSIIRRLRDKLAEPIGEAVRLPPPGERVEKKRNRRRLARLRLLGLKQSAKTLQQRPPPPPRSKKRVRRLCRQPTCKRCSSRNQSPCRSRRRDSQISLVLSRRKASTRHGPSRKRRRPSPRNRRFRLLVHLPVRSPT